MSHARASAVAHARRLCPLTPARHPASRLLPPFKTWRGNEANLPLATARFRWFNRQRELKTTTKKHNKQFAASAAV
jgi:predicted DCC family thiol-disulfide oxidoreductase YuxK